MWISVLEDEAVLNNLITKYLQKEGYSVRSYLRVIGTHEYGDVF